MEETDLSSLSEQEIMDMYSDVIESGEPILIAKCKNNLTSADCAKNNAFLTETAQGYCICTK